MRNETEVSVSEIRCAGGADGFMTGADKATFDILSVEETDDTLQAYRIARGVFDATAGIAQGGGAGKACGEVRGIGCDSPVVGAHRLGRPTELGQHSGAVAECA